MRYSDNCGCKFQNSTSGRLQKRVYEHRVFVEIGACCRRDDSAAPCCITETVKYFLVTKETDREHVNIESLVLVS